MSMLTCLSFNLTGSSAEAITKKFRAAVENAMDNSKELIGTWKLVWGPVVYADAFVGAKASVNSMFIAAPEKHPDQVVIAIAGTNGNSLVGWMLEDFNVKEKVPWPYGHSTLKPHISKGVAYGLGKLQGLVERKNGTAMTARDYLAANPSITRVMVTGHSLGGALSAAYSLYLENTRSEWDGSGSAAISCLATAGQTPGDEDFSKYYGETLGGTTRRVWNSIDIVPHVYQKDMLLQIPAIYEPHIPAQKPIEKLILSLRRETENNNYLNILPEAEGFPSTFLRLEDIAGANYKTFIDFIDSIVKMVKRANLFGSNDIVGSIEFLVDGLLQHIFPYFGHFKVDEFIKIMCSPVVAPVEKKSTLTSLFNRFLSFFKKRPSV